MPASQSALPLPLPQAKPQQSQPVDSSAETADLAASREAAAANGNPWDAAALAGRLVEITSGRPVTPSAAHNRHSSAIPSIWDIAPGRRGPSGDAGSAALTSAAGLVVQAQHLGEPVAWIGARASTFFPPDFDAGGIDLAALVVVRAADAAAAARAADKLLRSGAFGLVVLDLMVLGHGAHAFVPAPLLGRLLGLAQKHCAAVVFLTEKAADAPSLAPLVSLRVTTARRRTGPERFACTIEATKDKRRAPGWTCEETFRGPPGLR